jgi:hypothetical protein
VSEMRRLDRVSMDVIEIEYTHFFLSLFAPLHLTNSITRFRRVLVKIQGLVMRTSVYLAEDMIRNNLISAMVLKQHSLQSPRDCT